MGLFDWLFKPNVKELETNKDVDGLIKALGYKKDYEVRSQSAYALARIGDPRAIEPLISSCMAGSSAAERALEKFSSYPRAAQALFQIYYEREIRRREAREEPRGRMYIG